MKRNLLSLSLLFLSMGLHAQIATNYEVGTWSQFKPAAVSYTFDDNCPNQIPVALPLFDKYGFKVTFCTVTTSSWNPNWSKLQAAVNNGHEVASHTVDHNSLNMETLTQENTELQQSQSTILSNIPNAQCNIIAYPNCNEGDLATMQKYYIAGRVCSGQIVSKTPSDFFQISSIITGNTGSVQKAADFNNKASSAQSSGGWVVYLTHGIDNDGGYSPTQSSELASHLSYMEQNINNFWIATFGNVVKYIKERNALALKETTLTTDSLQVTATHNLDNNIYKVPVTVRRVVPTGWKGVKVYAGTKAITSTITSANGKSYVMFDVVPNQGNVYLANTQHAITGLIDRYANSSISAGPNPFYNEIVLSAEGDFSYTISSFDGRLIESGTGNGLLKTGDHFPSGIYLLSIASGSQILNTKIIKK